MNFDVIRRKAHQHARIIEHHVIDPHRFVMHLEIPILWLVDLKKRVAPYFVNLQTALRIDNQQPLNQIFSLAGNLFGQRIVAVKYFLVEYHRLLVFKWKFSSNHCTQHDAC
jgi:hypothetical protein